MFLQLCQVSVSENPDWLQLFFLTFLYGIMFVKWYINYAPKRMQISTLDSQN